MSAITSFTTLLYLIFPLFFHHASQKGSNKPHRCVSDNLASFCYLLPELNVTAHMLMHNIRQYSVITTRLLSCLEEPPLEGKFLLFSIDLQYHHRNGQSWKGL